MHGRPDDDDDDDELIVDFLWMNCTRKRLEKEDKDEVEMKTKQYNKYWLIILHADINRW